MTLNFVSVNCIATYTAMFFLIKIGILLKSYNLYLNFVSVNCIATYTAMLFFLIKIDILLKSYIYIILIHNISKKIFIFVGGGGGGG